MVSTQVKELPTIRGVRNPTNGEVIRELEAERSRQKITAMELAERTGIDYQRLNRLRKNQRSMTLTETMSICDALGVPLETILRFIHDMRALGR